MPGKTVYQLEGIVPKKPPEKQVTEIVEVFEELNRRKSGSDDTIAADVREPVGMTSDNYYG
jgi:hypothetical protein